MSSLGVGAKVPTQTLIFAFTAAAGELSWTASGRFAIIAVTFAISGMYLTKFSRTAGDVSLGAVHGSSGGMIAGRLSGGDGGRITGLYVLLNPGEKIYCQNTAAQTSYCNVVLEKLGE